jgi:ATP-binding cassette, subfamily C (CFTR/MRP), member 1
VCFIATIPVSTRSADAQKAWVERVETRIAITSTMLGDLKAIKMLGLEHVLLSLISGLRQIELNTSARFRRLLFAQVVIGKAGYNLILRTE